MNSSNTTTNNTHRENKYTDIPYITTTVIAIDSFILVIGLPVICLAIRGLYCMIKSDMVVPIYIINLLIADLLQIIIKPVILYSYIQPAHSDGFTVAYAISGKIFYLGLCASVWFMVCISLERYLIIAHPLWYRYRRSIRHTTLISGGVWLFAIMFSIILSVSYFIFNLYPIILGIVFPILCLLPFPLLVFFFFGTKRAIASATAVRDHEKRRILRILALVLGIYTVLFLPNCIVRFIIKITPNIYAIYAYNFTYQMIKLNALVDPVLYILLRPDVRNTLGSLPCCQRLFTLNNCWTPRDEQEETEYTATVSSTVTSV